METGIAETWKQSRRLNGPQVATSLGLNHASGRKHSHHMIHHNAGCLPGYPFTNDRFNTFNE